jgi:hypothetical protein
MDRASATARCTAYRAPRWRAVFSMTSSIGARRRRTDVERVLGGVAPHLSMLAAEMERRGSFFTLSKRKGLPHLFR